MVHVMKHELEFEKMNNTCAQNIVNNEATRCLNVFMFAERITCQNPNLHHPRNSRFNFVFYLFCMEIY